VIQRRLQDPLALQILEGTFRDGDTIEVDACGGELLTRKVPAGAASAAEPAAAAAGGAAS
jgi:hypothetical protein